MSTWLYAIARYTLAERSRARVLGHTLGSHASGLSGPESIAIRAEEARNLVAALESLPDEQSA